MTEHAFFSERAIRENEKYARRMFMDVPAGASPVDHCKARLGKELGPTLIRKILEEANRGTPPEVQHHALHEILGWMVASTLASIPNKKERLTYLVAAMTELHSSAVFYCMQDAQPGPEGTQGESIGGHG